MWHIYWYRRVKNPDLECHRSKYGRIHRQQTHLLQKYWILFILFLEEQTLQHLIFQSAELCTECVISSSLNWLSVATGIPWSVLLAVTFWPQAKILKCLINFSLNFLRAIFPTKPVDDEGTANEQVCEVEEELLCPLCRPFCSYHIRWTSGHFCSTYATWVL